MLITVFSDKSGVSLKLCHSSKQLRQSVSFNYYRHFKWNLFVILKLELSFGCIMYSNIQDSMPWNFPYLWHLVSVILDPSFTEHWFRWVSYIDGWSHLLYLKLCNFIFNECLIFRFGGQLTVTFYVLSPICYHIILHFLPRWSYSKFSF